MGSTFWEFFFFQPSESCWKNPTQPTWAGCLVRIDSLEGILCYYEQSLPKPVHSPLLATEALGPASPQTLRPPRTAGRCASSRWSGGPDWPPGDPATWWCFDGNPLAKQGKWGHCYILVVLIQGAVCGFPRAEIFTITSVISHINREHHQHWLVHPTQTSNLPSRDVLFEYSSKAKCLRKNLVMIHWLIIQYCHSFSQLFPLSYPLYLRKTFLDIYSSKEPMK